MNALGKERLLKLAAFLDTLPPENFDLREVISEQGDNSYEDIYRKGPSCGAVCCAIGWLPYALPEAVKFLSDWRIAVEVIPADETASKYRSSLIMGWELVGAEVFDLDRFVSYDSSECQMRI